MGGGCGDLRVIEFFEGVGFYVVLVDWFFWEYGVIVVRFFYFLGDIGNLDI